MAKREILNNDVVTLRVGENAVNAVEGVVGTATDVASDVAGTLVNVGELVEDQFDRVVTVTKNNPAVLVGCLVVGAAVGGFIAYKIAVKRTSLKYEEILREEIQAAKDFHFAVGKEAYPTPADAVADRISPDAVEVGQTVQRYQGRAEKIPYDQISTGKVIPEPEPLDETVTVAVSEDAVVVQVQQHNVFDPGGALNPAEWDYNVELQNRDVSKPYVISFEEFTTNEDQNDQVTFTYYAEDDTLVDERDKPFDDANGLVGDDNLLRFGAGSNDPNVVYIRNEKIEQDFEIVRSPGSYHREVLGVDPPSTHAIQHSHRRPRRGRDADE